MVDAYDQLVASGGDIDRPVFPRSAIKIMQALPLLLDGAASGLGLTSAELALACASHAGLPLHTQVASSMLRKAGVDVTALECGTHWPSEPVAARALAAERCEPTALHNNCSGKHAGFLCTATFRHIDPRGYVDAEHPVMQRVRECVEHVFAVDLSRASFGIDGCAIPTYAIPLRTLAGGFARLVTGLGLSEGFAEAAGQLRRAVAEHPVLIAGPGRFDTAVVEHFGESVFVKSGAEGVCCGAIPSLKLGFAVKCDDGTSRGADVAVAALLQRLLGSDHFLEGLSSRPLHNWNGARVGAVTATIP